jgi:hypothetical protein
VVVVGHGADRPGEVLSVGWEWFKG